MRILRVALALSVATSAGLTRAAADVGTIVFQDGAKVHGDVTESPAEIVLITPYGTRRFSRTNVLRIEYDAQDGPAGGNPPAAPPRVSTSRQATTGPSTEPKNGEAAS